MSSKLAKDLLKLPRVELDQKVSELRKELVEQKRARQAGELVNAHAIKKTRRSIAIALTLLARESADNVKEAK